MLALSETKVKGKGECNFGSVVGKLSGEVNGRARVGIALLLIKREWCETFRRVGHRVGG